MVPGMSVICNQPTRLVAGGDFINFSRRENFRSEITLFPAAILLQTRKQEGLFDYNNNNNSNIYDIIIQFLYL
jgi:hypothetical protein